MALAKSSLNQEVNQFTKQEKKKAFIVDEGRGQKKEVYVFRLNMH